MCGHSLHCLCRALQTVQYFKAVLSRGLESLIRVLEPNAHQPANIEWPGAPELSSPPPNTRDYHSIAHSFIAHVRNLQSLHVQHENMQNVQVRLFCLFSQIICSTFLHCNNCVLAGPVVFVCVLHLVVCNFEFVMSNTK